MDIPKQKILVVDDEESVLRSLEVLFSEEYTLLSAANATDALSCVFSKTIDLVLLDIDLPDKNGFEVLEEIKGFDPDIEVVMITADRNTQSAVRAIKMGASDYITKPFDIDDIMLTVKRVLRERVKAQELSVFKEEVKRLSDQCSIVGVSESVRELLSLIDKVSRARSTVLITGESGVGKELVAREIHARGVSGDAPFVAVNCGAIPDALLESELFGHERGAFTGAAQKKVGKFERAGEGTIFLDEISTMPMRLQTKLLRVLQEREVERVGGSRLVPVRARIIAATNVNLKQLISRGKFREDLFHRLNVIHVDVEPLRQRLEDIPILTTFFIGQFSERFRVPPATISEEVKEVFLSYRWPGNVRELSNIIERLILTVHGNTIERQHLPPDLMIDIRAQKGVSAKKGLGVSFKKERAQFERDVIIETLCQTNFNQSRAARLLGVHRNTLLLKCQQYAIDVPQMKKDYRK